MIKIIPQVQQAGGTSFGSLGIAHASPTLAPLAYDCFHLAASICHPVLRVTNDTYTT